MIVEPFCHRDLLVLRRTVEQKNCILGYGADDDGRDRLDGVVLNVFEPGPHVRSVLARIARSQRLFSVLVICEDSLPSVYSEVSGGLWGCGHAEQTLGSRSGYPARTLIGHDEPRESGTDLPAQTAEAEEVPSPDGPVPNTELLGGLPRGEPRIFHYFAGDIQQETGRCRCATGVPVRPDHFRRHDAHLHRCVPVRVIPHRELVFPSQWGQFRTQAASSTSALASARRHADFSATSNFLTRSAEIGGMSLRRSFHRAWVDFGMSFS